MLICTAKFAQHGLFLSWHSMGQSLQLSLILLLYFLVKNIEAHSCEVTSMRSQKEWAAGRGLGCGCVGCALWSAASHQIEFI